MTIISIFDSVMKKNEIHFNQIECFFLVWILGFFSKKIFLCKFFSFKDSWFILVEWTDSVSLLGIFYFIIKFNFLPIMMYVWQKRMFERRKKDCNKRNTMFFRLKVNLKWWKFCFPNWKISHKNSWLIFLQRFCFFKAKQKKENYENFL